MILEVMYVTVWLYTWLILLFQHLEKIHHILKDVFLIFPNYCLGRGLMDIAFNQYKNDFYFKTGNYNIIAHTNYTLSMSLRNNLFGL